MEEDQQGRAGEFNRWLLRSLMTKMSKQLGELTGIRVWSQRKGVPEGRQQHRPWGGGG